MKSGCDKSIPLIKYFAIHNESRLQMIRRLLILAVFATVMVVTAACAPTPELRNDNLLVDSSFLDNEPCGPPCWRGITPGETEWNAALDLIEDSADLENLETRTSDDSDVIGAIWAPADGDSCCQMYTEDGELVDIVIVQTTPVNTLGETIDTHGEPTYLIGETLSDDQGVFTLFYPDIQMLIYAFVAGEEGALAESSEVIGFAYFSPSRMELLTQTNDLHEWDGYGTYAEYMDSDFEVTPSVTLTPRPEDE